MSDSTNTDILSELQSRESSPPLAPLIIGHDAEVKRILQILEKRAPHLVVLTGEAGVGKTSLLNLIRIKAAASGWTVMPRDVSEEFNVSRETTETTFCARISDLMATPTGESFVETKSSQLDLPPVVKQLRERAPVLVLIDGFDSTPEFASWFSDQFIREIKESRAPIVVALGDRPENTKQISPVADEVLSLGRVNKRSIKDHFESLGRLAKPPIETAELEQYIEAAHEKPELLGSLTRILRLAALDR